MEARSIFANPEPVALMEQIQHAVVNCNVQEAGELFQRHPEMLQQEVTLFDPSGCRLENTNYFKHALWTLNDAMCREMIDCAAGSDQSSTLLNALLKQFHSWKENGVEYKRKDEHYQKTHKEQYIGSAYQYDYPNNVKQSLWDDILNKLNKILSLDQYIESKQPQSVNKHGI